VRVRVRVRVGEGVKVRVRMRVRVGEGVKVRVRVGVRVRGVAWTKGSVIPETSCSGAYLNPAFLVLKMKTDKRQGVWP